MRSVGDENQLTKFRAV